MSQGRAARERSRVRFATLLRVGAGVALLVGAVLFFRTVATRDLWNAVRSARWQFLVLAAALNLATIVVKTERWRRILATVAPIAYREVLRFLLIGFAVNSVLPVNAGDVTRIYLVAARTALRRSTVLSTIVVERVVEGIALGSMMLVALPVLREIPWLSRAAFVFDAAILALLLALVAFALFHRPAGVARTQTGHLFAALAENVRRLQALPVLGTVLALSVAEWVLQTLSYACGLVAFGQPFRVGAAFVALVAVNLALLARVTPGGVGAYQLAFAASMALFGVPKAVGLACSAALHAATLLPPVAIGLTLLAASPREMRRAAWGARRRDTTGT